MLRDSKVGLMIGSSRIIFTIFILNALIGHSSHAQEYGLQFQLIPGGSGINLGKVNAIAQDADGFLWLSDQSLRSVIRYDGQTMKRYSFDQSDSNSLGGYYPECLYIDPSGIIWIGFYGQGLDRFDPQTEKFTHFEHDPNNPTSLIDNTVSSIMKDSEGKIWVGTNSGISILDEATGEFTHLVHDPRDTSSLSHNVVRTIYEDRNGTIWVGTGFAFMMDKMGGLNRYHPSDSSFTRYLYDPNDPYSISHNKVRVIFEDSNDNFWIGTGGIGLQTMNRETGQFNRYIYDEKNPQALSRGPMVSLWDHVTFITEDSENHIWIGTESNGIRRYNPNTEQTIHYIRGNQYGDLAGFEDVSGWAALVANDGLIWITTQESSLYQVDLLNIVINKVEFDLGANSFIDDTLGNVWLASDHGLIYVDDRGKILKQFTHSQNDTTTISANPVYDILKGPEGNIWVGTASGVDRFDPISETFRRFLRTPDSGPVRDILYDGDSTIWIASEDQGVFSVNIQNGRTKHFQHDPPNNNTIAGNWIFCLAQDESGDILVGHQNGDGISKIYRKTGNVERVYTGISVPDLEIDHRGDAWACTPNGMYIQPKGDNTFVSVLEIFPEADIGSWLKSIIEDDDGNLWVGASEGIFRINAERDNLIVFGKENGVIGASSDLLDYVDKGHSGMIYFTGYQGFYVLDPKEIHLSNDNTDLFFTDIWINGRDIKEHPSTDIRSYSKLNSLRLKHNENLIGLRFSVTDYRSIGNKVIQYKLENFENEWRETLSGQRVNYYNLPPGDYTFLIKTNKNINGEVITKSFNIHIAKPWWTQWWAYALFALLLVSFIYALIKYRTRKLQQEKLLLEEKVKGRTKELNQSLDNLKATQAQLIQSEKMASLGELTAGIAHEIQNPLNFVNNFSDVSKELLEEMKEELESGDKDEVAAIANDLIQNLDKIHHHGRRADAIVKGMLQHSRTNSGEKESTDLNELADEYLRLAYHGLRAKESSFNASFETHFDKDLPKVNVIPQDIGRVLLNLINNAFQAVNDERKNRLKADEGPGGLQMSEPQSARVAEDGYAPKVSISTSLENDRVVIKVEDNGPGIPDDIKDKIFQPFFTTKPTGQGTGLGLSLSYDIVKAHGGELILKSEEGKGAQFIIKIPNKNWSQ